MILRSNVAPADKQVKSANAPRRTKKSDGGYEVGGYKCTDLGNAERFYRANCDNAKHCATWKKWLIWDGKRWKVDDEKQAVVLAAKVARSLWDDMPKLRNRPYHERMDFLRFCQQSESASKINAQLSLAAGKCPITHLELDKDPWLLNCPNGVVDLRIGELRNHDPGDYITKLCPTRFDPLATCPHWEAFIYSVFRKNEEMVTFMQRYLGWCLSGDVSEDLLAVFWGAGSNGKSTLIETVLAVMGGEYASPGSEELVREKKGDSHPTHVADLFGRRFCPIVETPEDMRMDVAKVKRLTGRDKLKARRMREDLWDFTPSHKIVLCTNYKPQVVDMSHALWRRLCLVEFPQRFWDSDKGETGEPDLRVNKELANKLVQEREGILAWMVRGCVARRKYGLALPKSVLAATAGYRDSEDVIGRFINECCVIAPTAKVKFSQFQAAFRKWCQDEGVDQQPSTRSIGSYLGKSYRSRKQSCTYYDGIGLLADESELGTEYSDA
jgi:putative DNA primase/helicase